MNPVPLFERHLVAIPSTAPSPSVQQIWFAAQQRPWTTLGIVAPDPRDGVYLLAAALVAVGRLTDTGEIDLLDAQSGGLGDVARHLATMTQVRTRGTRLVVVTDPVTVNPIALPLLRAADAVVLVLTLGRSRLAAAAQTVELIGRERVLGVALLNPGAIP
jgi:hypothetical protein